MTRNKASGTRCSCGYWSYKAGKKAKICKDCGGWKQ